MKRSSHRTAPLTFTSLLFATSTLLSIAPAQAAPLKEARVTQVINDVKILPGQAAAKPAVVNDEVREGTAVRTGTESRTELTFGDLSIARLGANTIFSFDQGSRSVELGGGAILLRVPKDSGGGKIKTAAVTAAITGTTVMAEFNCEDQSLNRIQTRCPDANFKFIVLEGSMRVCKTANPRDCVDLGPGQMLAGSIDQPLGDPIDIDLSRLLATSLLIQGFPPLGSRDDIAAAVAAQGGLLDIGYLGDDIATLAVNARDQRTAALPMDSPTPTPTASPTPAPTATPPPTPSPTPSPTVTPSPTPQPTPQKFGTPPIITSSVPYTITSDTVIVTDPTITTNGVTDEGRIYRGPADDGNPSTYFFTTSRAFDTTSGFDQRYSSGSDIPIATFKFLALQLAGNPTISTANGGPANLALISVGDMTTGAGGPLTFAGLQHLLLATQNGSITLGSAISFQNIPSLFVYARGATSTLTVDSAIFGGRDLVLQSEGALRATNALIVEQEAFAGQTTGRSIVLRAGTVINIGGDLSLTTEAGNIQQGANIFVISGGNMVIGGTLALTITVEGDTTTGTGGNIEVRSGGSLTAGQIIFESPFGSSRSVTNGANTTLAVTGDLTTTIGGISFSHATPVFDSPSTLGSGGNLTLTVGGNLVTAAGATVRMDLVNTSGSTVINGANIFASVGGNFTTGQVLLSSTNAGDGTTQTGSNITLDIGGNLNVSLLSADLDNTDGGEIGNGGNITLDVGGNISLANLFATINNGAFPVGDSVNGAPFGGTITTGGNITLGVDGDVTASSVALQILNGGGSIGTGGNIAATIDGDLNATSATFLIDNDDGGSIGNGGNVTLNINGNLAVQALFATIDNGTEGEDEGPDGVLLAGNISTGGNISLTVDGNLTAPEGVTLRVNNSEGTIGSGGNITGTFDGSVNAQFFTAEVVNSAAGSIGSGGNISFTSNGRVFFGEDQTLALHVINNGGTIGSGGNVSGLVRDNFTGGVNLRVSNNGNGSIITTGANVRMEVTGDLTADLEGGFNLRVSNNSRGVIGTGGNVTGIVGGDFDGGTINARVQNNSQGRITNGGNVTIEIDGSLTTEPEEGSLTLRVANNSGGRIDTGGNVSSTIGGDVTTAAIDLAIDNNNAGIIGQGGNISLTIDGFVETQTFSLRINNAAGSIATGGNITAEIGENLEAFLIDATIDSRTGGSIGNGGLMDIAVGGNMITTFGNPLVPNGVDPIGDANFSIYVTPLSGGAGNGGISGPAILVRASNFNIAGSFNAFIDDSGGLGVPSGQTGTVQITASNNFTVGSRLNVLGTVTGNRVTAETIAATDVNAGTITAGDGGIRQFEMPTNGGRVDITHVLSADTITSQGGINFDGYAAVGDVSFATNGGRLQLDTNFLTFGTDNPNISGSVTLNGGNSSTAFGAGDGGELTVNATGAIFVGLDIEATSGLVESNLGPSGSGGSVTLASSQNIVDIDARIEVSSADPAPPEPPTPPRRRSVQGGNIAIRSGRVGAPTAPNGLPRTVAVNISNSSQLLALLDAAAPTGAKGGKITILATGANSDVNVNGRLAATRGTIDIRHEADGGRVNIGNASGVETRTIMSADVIKARAFGANGQLNIGHSSIAGESLIRLYAQGSNGQLNFVANTTLSGNNRIDLAANTITIQPNVIVTITGDAGPAHVFTNNPNYSGFGGTTPGNGTFGGNGAHQPQPLVNAPPFDDPPPARGGH